MAAVLLVASIASGARGEPPPDEGSWKFSVAPYIWIPAMTGSATAKGMKFDFDAGGSNHPLKAWAEPFLGARGAVRFGADDRWRA